MVSRFLPGPARTQPDGTRIFASSAIFPPSQSPMATMRGCPKLPLPAVRFSKQYVSLGGGNSFFHIFLGVAGTGCRKTGSLSSFVQKDGGLSNRLNATGANHAF